MILEVTGKEELQRRAEQKAKEIDGRHFDDKSTVDDRKKRRHRRRYRSRRRHRRRHRHHRRSRRSHRRLDHDGSKEGEEEEDIGNLSYRHRQQVLRDRREKAQRDASKDSARTRRRAERLRRMYGGDYVEQAGDWKEFVSAETGATYYFNRCVWGWCVCGAWWSHAMIVALWSLQHYQEERVDPADHSCTAHGGG